MPFRRVFYPDFVLPPEGGGGGFALSDLFSGAEAGFAFDYTDLSTLYQDSARTTQCTAAADPINGADDVSGNAHHIGWSSGVVVGGSAGAYYADLTDDFIQLPNATPDPAYFLIVLDCQDTKGIIARNINTRYFGATRQSGGTLIDQGITAAVYTINGNNPTTSAQLYTELTTGSQPKLLEVDNIDGGHQYTIGGYTAAGFDLTAKIYGAICRDTDFSAGEITNVLSYFGAF